MEEDVVDGHARHMEKMRNVCNIVALGPFDVDAYME
jgi:hypothetical protein